MSSGSAGSHRTVRPGGELLFVSLKLFLAAAAAARRKVINWKWQKHCVDKWQRWKLYDVATELVIGCTFSWETS